MTSTTTTSTEDRRLLAEVSRLRRANDWRDSSRGFQNAPFEDQATVAVRPNEAGFQVWRKPADAPHFTGQPTEYPAESVREAVDLLVALNILPDSFSSAYREGRNQAAADVERMPITLGDAGWQHMEASAVEADYPAELVRRRRTRDDFTTATIEGAYQYGYRQAAKVARGGTR
ncbi:hypothetical protein MED01_004233 [Micromonospora sp. MED01]|uniref:hypothetical protein n=1 Tax=Micromonospora alfalfae TaxID=2911212 RepID=UPI001EE8986B|nr:hypothetical protein [Micromonospora alfalfae]MCG5460807.1 hypothetical protein [Micromonospora alfalfae]